MVIAVVIFVGVGAALLGFALAGLFILRVAHNRSHLDYLRAQTAIQSLGGESEFRSHMRLLACLGIFFLMAGVVTWFADNGRNVGWGWPATFWFVGGLLIVTGIYALRALPVNNHLIYKVLPNTWQTQDLEFFKTIMQVTVVLGGLLALCGLVLTSGILSKR